MYWTIGMGLSMSTDDKYLSDKAKLLNTQLLAFVRAKDSTSPATVSCPVLKPIVTNKQDARNAIRILNAFTTGKCKVSMTNSELRGKGFDARLARKVAKIIGLDD